VSEDCGGCAGLGSHRRWCIAVVGMFAAWFGAMAEQAEHMADQVGANEPGAANHLYIAAGLIRKRAQASIAAPVVSSTPREASDDA
jgi:hypothetical protein